MSARFIKATDVTYFLRHWYGRKPTPALLSELSQLVLGRIELRAGRSTDLPKVQTWQPSEDELRLKFGGTRALLRCWGCNKKKADVNQTGQRCADCKRKQAGGGS